MSKICAKCGKEMPDKSNFCEYCGAAMPDYEAKETLKDTSAPMQKQAILSKRKIPIWAVIVACAVTICIVAAAVVMGTKGQGVPQEQKIKEDLLSPEFDISVTWIQSRENVDIVNAYLPYEITSLSIEKRDTRPKEKWDTVWFSFEATNTIHKYVGDGYADYRLYSEGGWIMENCTIEHYESSPDSEPRFAEFAAILGEITDIRDFPENPDSAHVTLDECYLSTKDFPKEYAEYRDGDVFPYDGPIAIFQLDGKAGLKDDFLTQAKNPSYILGYMPDTQDGYSGGWYYHGIAFNSTGVPSEGKNEWRLYQADESSGQTSKYELLIVQIVDGAVADLEYSLPELAQFHATTLDWEWDTEIPTAINAYGNMATEDMPKEWSSAYNSSYYFTIDGSTVTGTVDYQDKTYHLVETCALDQRPSMNVWEHKYADEFSEGNQAEAEA